MGKHLFLFSFEAHNKLGSFLLTWDLSQERAMSLTAPKSILRCILLLRQEDGSPSSELMLACVEPVKVVCLPVLFILEIRAWSEVGVTVLTQKRAAPHKVSSLVLLLPWDLPKHIDIHLPFYFSSPANSLAPPGFMFFRNISSWDPGNILVFSFLPHWPFLFVGPFE